MVGATPVGHDGAMTQGIRAARRAAVMLSATLALGGLAGCGSDDDSGSGTGSGGAGATSVEGAQAEVDRLAVALESYYRGAGYPETLDDAVASLPGAGLSATAGYTVAGYVYDPDAVEFTLCVEDADGAWATYDTAPMSVRDSGDSGGCSI